MKTDNPTGIPRWRTMLDAAASLSVVIVCAALTWTLLLGSPPFGSPTVRSPNLERGRAGALPSSPISIVGARTRGKAAAAVVIIEYSDFQCPFCASFAKQTLPTLNRDYVDTGKVLMAFRHLPLESIHPFAFDAAVAAECAGEQDKFWEMHDLLFETPKELNTEKFNQYGEALQLNAAFGECLKGDMRKKIRAEMQSVASLGLATTPTFFIGPREADGRVRVTARISGAAPLERFEAEIDRVVERASNASR